MGYRDFRDATGTAWSAWDVVPQLVERRQGPRRATGTPAPVPGFTGTLGIHERRMGLDRRMIRSRRAYLNDGFARGWLCFESHAEKRRLTPIPSDWLRCREAQLVAYCEQAARVGNSAREGRVLQAVPDRGPADAPDTPGTTGHAERSG